MFMFSRRSCHWKVWTMPQPWRVWFDQLIWNKDTLKCLNSLERLVWSADTEYNQPIECLNSSESLVWSADMEYYQPKVSEQFRESRVISWKEIESTWSVWTDPRVFCDQLIQNIINLSSVWTVPRVLCDQRIWNIINLKCLNSSESLV